MHPGAEGNDRRRPGSDLISPFRPDICLDRTVRVRRSGSVERNGLRAIFIGIHHRLIAPRIGGGRLITWARPGVIEIGYFNGI